jgi:hypothetical protein
LNLNVEINLYAVEPEGLERQGLRFKAACQVSVPPVFRSQTAWHEECPIVWTFTCILYDLNTGREPIVVSAQVKLCVKSRAESNEASSMKLGLGMKVAWDITQYACG